MDQIKNKLGIFGKY